MTAWPTVVPVFVDAVVVVSAVLALARAPRVPAAVRRVLPRPPTGRSVPPLAALAVVTGLVYVNQVLFTVYVLRVHGGDASFVARYLPTGWFELASGSPVVRRLADAFPAPELLAPSVLRVQAFLELPFVLLAFAAVVRWFDAGLYRAIARSALLPLASVSYTVVFCLVEWDLRNPYTVDDIVVRAVSAALTSLLVARLAARDSGVTRTPASVSGLLVFIGSLGALGALVLVVYDTALLYNLGRLDDRLPLALAAAGLLAALRGVAHRLREDRSAPGLAMSFVRHALSRWLALFFVPALAVRYGVVFGTPWLAAGAALVIGAAACLGAGRDTVAGPEDATDAAGLRTGRRRTLALLLAGRLTCAGLAGAGAAYVAVSLSPGPYYETRALSAGAAFLMTAVVACGVVDVVDRRRPGAGSPAQARSSPSASWCEGRPGRS
ncbi:hypothetical protein [Streptomyces sp. MK7]|uniref:hypothetical protein n=1 Tax=Streptomyces sp. MK7 TaxID=3067635 RepID=UPI00292CECB8|nr:hypothetical protein [Streptomyces sp. MK7]